MLELSDVRVCENNLASMRVHGQWNILNWDISCFSSFHSLGTQLTKEGREFFLNNRGFFGLSFLLFLLLDNLPLVLDDDLEVPILLELICDLNGEFKDFIENGCHIPLFLGLPASDVGF